MKKYVRLLAVAVFIFGILHGTPVYGKRSGTLASTSAGSVKDVWKQKLQAVQEERKVVRNEIRTRINEATETAKLKREEFKNRLAEVKDVRKRLTLERIDLNLGKINEKWVERWNLNLARLSELLVKMQSRADKLEGEGVDVSDVQVAIVAAEGAIADAQEAVNIQAGKIYIIEIEDDNLGGAASAVIQQLRNDLKEVMDVVKLARESVAEVLWELRGWDIRPAELQ